MKKSLVSIILLNFNGLNYTLECIKSLKKIDYKNHEVIVVDNASTDNSVSVLRKIKRIKLIESKRNLGFAGGNNLGARHAKGKYVVFLNNDAFVKRKWLSTLMTAMESDKKIGCVMSKIYNRYDNKDYRFDGYGTTSLIGLSASYENIPLNTKKYVKIFSPSGCALMYDKKLVKRPFDPDYFIYYEDTSLGWILRLKGYDVITVPDSIVYHEGNAVIKNIKSMSNFFTYLGERNRLLNLFTMYSGLTLIKLIPQMLFSILFINIYDLKRFPIRVKSYWWLLAHVPVINKKRKLIQSKRKVKDKEVIKYMSYKLFDDAAVNNNFLKSVIKIINTLNLVYCKIFRIKTYEFYHKN